MAAERITELRLTSFKSYRDVALLLAPLTVLIGRNGGGKSNALDALVLQGQMYGGPSLTCDDASAAPLTTRRFSWK